MQSNENYLPINIFSSKAISIILSLSYLFKILFENIVKILFATILSCILLHITDVMRMASSLAEVNEANAVSALSSLLQRLPPEDASPTLYFDTPFVRLVAAAKRAIIY